MSRRRWLITGSACVATVAVVVVVLPWLMAPLSAKLVEGEWGGRIDVGKARWYGGKVIYLEHVEAFIDGQVAPMITAESITVHLENNPIFGNPGLLLLGVLTKATLAHEGHLASLDRVTYHREGDHRSLDIGGLKADFDWTARSHWIVALKRIVEAPGIAPKGGGPLLEALAVDDSQIDLMLDWREAKRRVPVRVDHVQLGAAAEKQDAFNLVIARGQLLGGKFSAFGHLDFSETGKTAAQLNLVDLELSEAARLELLAAESSGQTTVYLNLGVGSDRALTGAGWIEGRNVRVWKEPHVSAVISQLGLATADDSALRQVKGSVRLDRGRIYLTEMICLGSPLNVFGNGSCLLDGSDLRVGLVPRVFGEEIDQKADAPQLLLDVLTGALVEIRVSGELKNPVVEVAPLSVVSDPLRAFIDLFHSAPAPGPR